MSQQYYEEYWDKNKIGLGSHLIWKKNLLSKLKLKGKNYLDIGCGNGFMASQFVNKFDVYGIDISSHALIEANKLGIITNQIDANSETLPFEDKYFDNIACLDVLEHIMDPLNYCNEINRVIEDKGKFIVCVPNALNIFNRIYFLLGNFTDIMDVAHKNNELFSEHIRLFSKNNFEKLIHLSGFSIKEKHFYFPQNFTEDKWKKYQWIGNLINKCKIPQLFPSLFAFGFLYVCKKK